MLSLCFLVLCRRLLRNWVLDLNMNSLSKADQILFANWHWHWDITLNIGSDIEDNSQLTNNLSFFFHRAYSGLGFVIRLGSVAEIAGWTWLIGAGQAMYPSKCFSRSWALTVESFCDCQKRKFVLVSLGVMAWKLEEKVDDDNMDDKEWLSPIWEWSLSPIDNRSRLAIQDEP